MGLNPNAVSPSQYRNQRITECELFVAKVKLAGLFVLGLVCSVVLVVSPP